MKVLFICGALEPGCDGVGDYSRRLAIELIKKGHQAAIIALNDPYLTEAFSGTQMYEETLLPVFRLPSVVHANTRFQLASTWVNEFNPDWLSLQFVPFAFHPKGLPFGMGSKLSAFGKSKRWHVMVHELWVGMDEEASYKAIYWGWLQKQLIKAIFSKINPLLIHTQSVLYIKMLKELGFKTNQLPLFGNISVAENYSVNNKRLDISFVTSDVISLVVFGGIHPGVPVEDLIKDVKSYSLNHEKKIMLQMIGRCGSEQSRWETLWTNAGFSVKIFGEQPEENISAVLSSASYGISTTPPSLIEKSGSVAAMLEHGLPVLCISRPWHPRGFSESRLPGGIVEYKYGQLESFFLLKKGSIKTNNISDITDQFINELTLIK